MGTVPEDGTIPEEPVAEEPVAEEPVAEAEEPMPARAASSAMRGKCDAPVRAVVSTSSFASGASERRGGDWTRVYWNVVYERPWPKATIGVPV